MKKLLFVINETSYFFSHRLALATAAQAQGWEIHVAVPTLTETDHASFQRVNMTPHKFFGSNSGFPIISEETKLKGTINDIDPDLVHLVTLKSSWRWFLLLPFVFKIKSVHTIAGFGQLAGSHFFARLGKMVTKIMLAIQSRLTPSLYVVQNPTEAAELCRQMVIPAQRLFLVQGSGVDIAAYAPGSEKASGKILHIGTACRRLKSKGLFALMEVARLIKAQKLPIEIHIASVPVPESHSEAISMTEWAAWQNEGLFTDAGQVSDMPSFYRQLDGFIYLSTSGEGLAKTLLEAGSSGLPIITTRQPGCKEAVISNITGHLVDPRNSEETLDHLKEWLNAPEKRLEMGKESRKHVIAHFSDAIVTKHMLELYKKAEHL